MCGISGIISKKSVGKIETRIQNMNNSILHRGPNKNIIKCLNNMVAFGQVRLPDDVNTEFNQPMISNNNEWLIAYDGKIFNYKEIKKKLNYNFKTNSEIEVILAAVETKGLDWFLERANGMFAFALFNLKDNIIMLVKDRFGIKPFYYLLEDDTLIFSSEIKGILASGLHKPNLFEPAIDEYLGNRYIREPYTFFKNIFQVNSGEYITFDEQLNITNTKYYELPNLNFDTEYDEELIIQRTKEEILKAIQRWSIADNKVGTFLSGGVDSSLTTAITAINKKKSQLNTYTIGFREYNEFEYSDIVAKKYNTIHQKVEMDYDEYINEWYELIGHNDSPLAVPNEIPLAKMSEVISNDLNIVISGEGADELFGGYGKIFRLAYDYSNSNQKENFYNVFINEYEYVPRYIRDKYLNTDFTLRNYFDNLISNEFGVYKNEENIFRFFHNYHIKGLLKRLDMTSMKNSVEARTPFLDYQLVNFVYTQVPYELKLRWNSIEDLSLAKLEKAKHYSEYRDTPKYILKKISEEFLPSEIIYRKKVGFPVPLSNWQKKLNEIALKILVDCKWLNKSMLKELIEEAQRNPRSGQILWMLINVELFIQKYFSKEWRY